MLAKQLWKALEMLLKWGGGTGGVLLTARSAVTWDNSLLLWHGEGSPPSLNAHLAAAGSH